MICKQCKHKLPDDSEFCQYCGNKIENDEVVESDTLDDNVPELIDELSKTDITPDDALSAILKFQAKATIDAMEANADSQPDNEGDDNFGLVPEKPIFTLALKSVDGEEEYLDKLYTDSGEKIKYIRRGSTSIEGINGMIDIYDTFFPSGEPYKTIYINMYGASSSNTAPKGFNFGTHNHISKTDATKEDTINPPEKKKKIVIKKNYIIIGIAVLLVLITSITIGIASHRNNLYNELTELMLNVDYSNVDSIGDIIEDLPSDYKDVAEIKKEYNQIQKQIKVIKSAEAKNDADSNKTREAYVALYNFNTSHHNWDLNGFLDSVLNRHFDNFVFGKEWENNTFRFYWHGDGDGSEYLATNLPNDKEDNKDYYFYHEGSGGFFLSLQFGYENKNDVFDKFLAYRIVDVYYTGSKWQIKIYCYSNSMTYTLY